MCPRVGKRVHGRNERLLSLPLLPLLPPLPLLPLPLSTVFWKRGVESWGCRVRGVTQAAGQPSSLSSQTHLKAPRLRGVASGPLLSGPKTDVP